MGNTETAGKCEACGRATTALMDDPSGATSKLIFLCDWNCYLMRMNSR
jgi:hypothetical protein